MITGCDRLGRGQLAITNCDLKTALRARGHARAGGAQNARMLAQVMPRRPAPMLARGAPWLRPHVRPTAFGNALGNAVVDSMQPTQGTGPWSDKNYTNEYDKQSDQAYEARRSQEWITQSDAIQQRVMRDAAAPHREQQWIDQNDAIMARRAEEALAGRNGMDVQSDAWVAANGQGKVGYRALTPPVRPNSAASERQRELNRFAEMGAASGAAPVWNMRDASAAQREQARRDYEERLARLPGQYLSPSTGDGLSPIQRYLRDSLRGMDPARSNRVEAQLAFGVQDGVVSEFGGLVAGAAVRLARAGVMGARGAILSEQSLLRTELSAELKTALRADLPLSPPIDGLALRIDSAAAHGVAPGPVNFMGRTDSFYLNASRRSDIDPNGVFDVIAHGSTQQIEVMTGSGKVILADQRLVARLIENSPAYTAGQPIRLLSCSTGACDAGFAQNLANKMGVPVQAPTDLVWAYGNGSMVVAPRTSLDPKSYFFNVPDLANQGSFRTFLPGRRP